MGHPFDLADTAAYAAWREKKLDTAPRRIEDILVPLDDPRALTTGERDALLERCATTASPYLARISLWGISCKYPL
jgi:hypothetical protein